MAEYESGVGFVSKHPNQKLIVVEDDAVVAGALMALLRNEGYDPVVFHNGQPALTYLRENNADAALIDIHLPDISGLDLSHRVREMKGQSLPIFILSGDNGMETLRALPQAGATYFFSKPVNTSHLLDQIRACF